MAASLPAALLGHEQRTRFPAVRILTGDAHTSRGLMTIAIEVHDCPQIEQTRRGVSRANRPHAIPELVPSPDGWESGSDGSN